jgi:circadian clock protein KaiC
MKHVKAGERIKTGVKNLDELLDGGLPRDTVTVFAGSPGAGKTTLAQQICYNNASVNQKALIFQTLSEPVAKTMKYMGNFSFFDSKKLRECIEYVDLGGLLRSKGLENASQTMLKHIKRVGPAFVVIDSFKVFEDLADSKEDLRKFTYEIAVQLMAWEVTAFLLGEYNQEGMETSPLSSVVDGIITMTGRLNASDEHRLFKILKMRGTNHDQNSYPYEIGSDGIEIYGVRNSPPIHSRKSEVLKSVRLKSGISGLDPLIGGGLPLPSVNLLLGRSGMGKTLFILESICKGAEEQKEKGIIFSFEMNEQELCKQAVSLGLNLTKLIKSGMVEIIYIPQPNIFIERDIEMMQQRITKLGAKRVAVDSINVFLEKLREPQVVREKILQISTIIKSAGAIGFLTKDALSDELGAIRLGSDDSVPDAILLLSSEPGAESRQQFIEVLKMRNTDHAKGKNPFTIEKKGIKVLPRSKKLR